MKKMLLIFALFLSAKSLEIENLRTELYSKSGANVLKKIELSLEFEGENLEAKKSQLADSVNTVISGFFYEDIFTESGKNNFKKTLEKFIQKKYKFKVDEIYILALSGIEKFDLEEFKKFLQSAETKTTKNELKQILDSVEQRAEISQTNEIKETQKTSQTPKIPQNLFDDEEKNENNTDLNFENLDNTKAASELEEKIKKDLIQNQNLNQNSKQNSSQNLNQNLNQNPNQNSKKENNSQENALQESNLQEKNLKENVLQDKNLKENVLQDKNLKENNTKEFKQNLETNSSQEQNSSGFEVNFDENESVL